MEMARGHTGRGKASAPGPPTVKRAAYQRYGLAGFLVLEAANAAAVGVPRLGPASHPSALGPLQATTTAKVVVPGGQTTSSATVRALIARVALSSLGPNGTPGPGPTDAQMLGGNNPTAAAEIDNGGKCATFASDVVDKVAAILKIPSILTGGATYGWGLPADIEPRAATPTSVTADAANPIESVRGSFYKAGFYHAAGTYRPQQGDLAFFEWADGGTHVGIVVKTDSTGFWIVSDSSGVNLDDTEQQYSYGDPDITGYGSAGWAINAVQSGPTTVVALGDTVPGLASAVASAPPGSSPAPASTPEPWMAGIALMPPSATSPKAPSAAIPKASVGTPAQRAFINAIAPGAVAGQLKYGVPAAVTIAQAIDESSDESGWGQSELARIYHNLFGIKGEGPAGRVYLPTQEEVNGTYVWENAWFRVYHSYAESILDHAKLLHDYYPKAMADRSNPDKFAQDLTGTYATAEDYGSSLIGLMKTYNLYAFSTAAASGSTGSAPGTTPLSPTNGVPGLSLASATISVSKDTPINLVAYQRPVLSKQAVSPKTRQQAQRIVDPLGARQRTYEACVAHPKLGIPWQLLAAVDLGEAGAQLELSLRTGERISPSHKTNELMCTAAELILAAKRVYGIDLRAGRLSVDALAHAVAAFKSWSPVVQLGVSPLLLAYIGQGLEGPGVELPDMLYVDYSEIGHKGRNAGVRLTTKPRSGQPSVRFGIVTVMIILNYPFG